MLAVTGDHKCKRQSLPSVAFRRRLRLWRDGVAKEGAKCKVQNGQASWLSATIDHRPSTIDHHE
jgi:hypothetical protein